MRTKEVIPTDEFFNTGVDESKIKGYIIRNSKAYMSFIEDIPQVSTQSAENHEVYSSLVHEKVSKSNSKFYSETPFSWTEIVQVKVSSLPSNLSGPLATTSPSPQVVGGRRARTNDAKKEPSSGVKEISFKYRGSKSFRALTPRRSRRTHNGKGKNREIKLGKAAKSQDKVLLQLEGK